MTMMHELHDPTLADGGPIMVARSMPFGWGLWHVEMLYRARRFELVGIDVNAPLNDDTDLRMHGFGSYEFVGYFAFRDPDDGERLIIEPGTVHTSWRN